MFEDFYIYQKAQLKLEQNYFAKNFIFNGAYGNYYTQSSVLQSFIIANATIIIVVDVPGLKAYFIKKTFNYFIIIFFVGNR